MPLVGVTILLSLLLILTLAVTIVRRQLAEGRRQAHLEGEMRSAQEVQHILIPEGDPVGLVFAPTGTANRTTMSFMNRRRRAWEPLRDALQSYGTGKGTRAPRLHRQSRQAKGPALGWGLRRVVVDYCRCASKAATRSLRAAICL